MAPQPGHGCHLAPRPACVYPFGVVLELLIVILVLLWLMGYFGRGRLGSGRQLPTVGGYDLIHVLVVVALILLIIRLVR